MKLSQSLVLSLFASWILLLSACGDSKPAAAPLGWEHDFPMKIGDVEFRARLALLPAERSRGLMEVKELWENQGMLFISTKPERQAFWMRNTPLPLDIGFFDASGQLLELYPLNPFDESTVFSRSQELKFALEMPRGWFRKHQLFPDSRPRLNLDLVRKAIEQRGLTEQYPL